jgi:Winged helix-turn helix
MATVSAHLSVEELEERYVACGDATASRHFQAIWLLARGHTVSQVSATTAFGERWIEQLLARYNAEGPEALGDLRRRNGASATILRPDLLVAPAPWPAAARWRAVVEPQGRELDGRGGECGFRYFWTWIVSIWRLMQIWLKMGKRRARIGGSNR